MRSFPMFIATTGRRICIAGGGEQAAQKARLLLKTDAQLQLLAQELDPELEMLVLEGRATHDSGPITPHSFAGCPMAFVATGCPGMDAALHDLAQVAGVLTNVVDQPALCDITTPSLVDRDPVVVAIGTEGTAPVLARAVKSQVEAMLPPTTGQFAAMAGRLRAAVAQRVPRAHRRAFWAWAFKGAPWQAHKSGAEREAARLLKTAISDGRPPVATGGKITVIEAPTNAPDLLTLRAVERLQEADVIVHDAGIDDQVLELARRDAERLQLAEAAADWPPNRRFDAVTTHARDGQNVVILTCEAFALTGLTTAAPVEIVPAATAPAMPSAASA